MDYTKKTYKVIGFIIPALLVYGVFWLYPMFISVYYSMLSWNGTMASMHFTGLQNFVKLLHDKVFYIALRNSFINSGYAIVFKIPLALFFAVVISHPLVRAKKLFRMTYFMPCIVSASAVAILWNFIYDTNIGLLYQFFKSIGLPNAMPKGGWLGSYSYSIFFVFIPAIWSGVGWNFILYSAGMSGISPELYESADIDGATFLQKCFQITLPLLKQIIVISLILELSGSLQTFDSVFILTQGGPANATQVLGTYQYLQAFQNFHLGYGSAIGMAVFVMSVIYTLILKYFSRKDITD